MFCQLRKYIKWTYLTDVCKHCLDLEMRSRRRRRVTGSTCCKWTVKPNAYRSIYMPLRVVDIRCSNNNLGLDYLARLLRCYLLIGQLLIYTCAFTEYRQHIKSQYR